MQADPSVVMIDIRMEIESMYVGRPPGAIHVPWYEYPEFTPNAADFCATVENEVGNKNKTVVLLCRSGVRSIAAAKRANELGLKAYNILEGFEGDPDGSAQRGRRGGWRYRGLPWRQN